MNVAARGFPQLLQYVARLSRNHIHRIQYSSSEYLEYSKYTVSNERIAQYLILKFISHKLKSQHAYYLFVE
jgi:hypothetical protein